MDFLNKNFEDMFNYDYTKNMEDDLDKISRGEKVWYNLCDDCLKEINKCCDKLVDEKKCEIRIDDTHFYIIGKHGPVIKKINDMESGKKNNVSFLPVKEDLDIKKLERGEYKLQDIIAPAKQGQIHLGTYKSEPLFLKKGKFGLYVTWGQNSKSLSCFGNRPMDNVTLIDVLEILEKSEQTTSNDSISNSGIIRIINNNTSIRKGKYGDYVFYKTSKMSKPTFLKVDGFEEDYKTCTLKVLTNWLKANYGI
jgi:DNA topoisomerase-1